MRFIQILMIVIGRKFAPDQAPRRTAFAPSGRAALVLDDGHFDF